MSFTDYLSNQGKSENTIRSYAYAIKQFKQFLDREKSSGKEKCPKEEKHSAIKKECAKQGQPSGQMQPPNREELSKQTLAQPNEIQLLAYKKYLMGKYKISTVNQRLNAVNTYMRYAGICLEPVKLVKTSRVAYIDNVITEDEYERLKEGLRQEGKWQDYFIVRYLAATGVRAQKDISMLSDLLGHESIETTRIYLRKTADEQRQMIDRIVNW